MSMSSSDESDRDGLERVSSVKKTEERFSEVPEKKKYKLKIVTADKMDKFGYKLKRGISLPYNTTLKGSNLRELFLFA